MTTIAQNLSRVRERLAHAADQAGRTPRQISLVAVSKRQEVEAMRQALEAGQRIFGENRVQEAKSKWPLLKAEYPDIELHLIGPLQTNKVKEAVTLFDVIESLDRRSLAEALSKEMQRTGRNVPCLIQINSGEEAQKSGIAPHEADSFIEECLQSYGLTIRGVMCIPPADQDPLPHFRLLAEIAARHDLPILSMGMSADFEQAIQAGATHIRVGTAIFGDRV